MLLDNVISHICGGATMGSRMFCKGLFCLFVVMALAVLPCVEGAQTSKPVFKIGFIAPLTGPGATYGLAKLIRPQIMEVNDANAKGGINILR